MPLSREDLIACRPAARPSVLALDVSEGLVGVQSDGRCGARPSPLLDLAHCGARAQMQLRMGGTGAITSSIMTTMALRVSTLSSSLTLISTLLPLGLATRILIDP